MQGPPLTNTPAVSTGCEGFTNKSSDLENNEDYGLCHVCDGELMRPGTLHDDTTGRNIVVTFCPGCGEVVPDWDDAYRSEDAPDTGFKYLAGEGTTMPGDTNPETPWDQ